MKKLNKIRLSIAGIFAIGILIGGAASVFVKEQALLGAGTVFSIDQWRATSTPFEAATTRIHARNIYAPYSNATTSAFAITGVTSCTSLETTSDGDVICGSGTGGITDIGPAGQTVDGPVVTLATSTSAFNGLTPNLTITGAADTLTFTSALAGTLGVGGGGTGAATFGQGWLHTAGGTTAFTASTSPTVNYLTATSTTATSTFAGGLAIDSSGFVYVKSSGNVGVATTSPTAKLYVQGSFGCAASTTAVSITIGVDECMLFVNATGGTRTITLPAAASSLGRWYIIKKTDSSLNVVRIDPAGSETLDGDSDGADLLIQNTAVIIVSDGSQWFSISSN